MVCAWVALAAFLVTQIIIPVCKGMVLFPLLRTDLRRGHQEMSELKERMETLDVREEVEATREKLRARLEKPSVAPKVVEDQADDAQ